MAKAKSSTVKVGKTAIKGANEADKQNISLARKSIGKAPPMTEEQRAAKPPAEPVKKAVASGDDAPEAKATASEKKAAAKKLFDNADDAARAGLPADITVEQNDNRLRRSALGY